MWTHFKHHITIGHLFYNTIFIFLIQCDPKVLTGEVNVSDPRVLLLGGFPWEGANVCGHGGCMRICCGKSQSGEKGTTVADCLPRASHRGPCEAGHGEDIEGWRDGSPR